MTSNPSSAFIKCIIVITQKYFEIKWVKLKLWCLISFQFFCHLQAFEVPSKPLTLSFHTWPQEGAAHKLDVLIISNDDLLPNQNPLVRLCAGRCVCLRASHLVAPLLQPTSARLTGCSAERPRRTSQQQQVRPATRSCLWLVDFNSWKWLWASC